MSSDDAPKRTNLFDYTEEDLLEDNALTHYEVLNIPVYATFDDIKKGYRKASLKYHPDKTGRGDDDYVFLAVKRAYDTLTDSAKRQAYDSTVMPFDDEIPAPRAQMMQDPLLLYKDEDFYAVFGPVFERNLRFDARLRPENTKKKANNSNNRNSASKAPTLGDADTPLEEVHKFYEYWVHFESWRDFSQTAADELQIDQENADSRFEKRWLQKEIDKRAKQLKRQEMARIQRLVERASEADPRLRAERLERQQAKAEAARQRELDAEREKREKIEAELREKERLAEEKERKAEEKVAREKQKKLIRKERQQLRRMTSASFDSVKEEISDEFSWKDSYDMNVDVEHLCTSLSLEQLRQLNKKYSEHEDATDALRLIREKSQKVREGEDISEVEAEPDAKTSKEANGESVTTNGSGPELVKPAPSQPVKPEPSHSEEPSKATNPWTKDELSALAKGVKKYSAGAGNRWDQIANYLNNVCRQDEPRTKQECIEKYNVLTREAKNTSTTTESTKEPVQKAPEDDGWSAEQDQQLQDGLAKFPASMDKNERWTQIANCVDGKSKKDCAQRFKAIREAIQNRK